ncbi:hypothetical protein Sps_00687 [Shewanella psychrophila]|uniref:Nucleoside 2-deoxyribosyltransferase n=1 Tax=Shewanella psychrophila TaxID=225848 RepID=A0A1S6HK22_9GAMM|nr:hypothetical protein [Shewanella psychrophila]AQS35881.1 hypothetical protein Sps_00687 [Shewanella psychrophila]
MKLFIRQSFTQADSGQESLVQSVIDEIRREYACADFLTGTHALNKNSFIEYFEHQMKQEFTAKSFRQYRLGLIEQCDALIFIRTSMSESGAYELAYNLHSQKPKPVFYAHWVNAPIKTTLLRELDDEYPLVYNAFNSSDDILAGLSVFFKRYDLLEVESALA